MSERMFLGEVARAVQRYQTHLVDNPTHILLHPLDAERWMEGGQGLTSLYRLTVIQDHTIKRGTFVLGATHEVDRDG